MSKKHFKLFAEAIAKIENGNTREAQIVCCCLVFNSDNPRFSEDKFREYIRRLLAGEDLKGLR